jgi:hypothetical protein
MCARRIFFTLLALAELLLDRLHLLVQVVLALALLHLPLDAAADALFDLQDVDLGLELRQEVLEALLDVEHLEHLLLLLELERQVRRHGVGEAPRLVDAGKRSEDLRRDLLVQLDVLVERGEQRAAHRLDLGQRRVVERHRHGFRDPVRSHVDHVADVRAGAAFYQYFDCPIGQLQHLQDVRHAANRIHVLRAGIVLRGGLLRHEQDRFPCFHRGFHRLDGLGSPDEQRDHHVGEHHHIAQGQQRILDAVRGGRCLVGHLE